MNALLIPLLLTAVGFGLVIVAFRGRRVGSMVHCRCGYPLEGLAGPRCPECGADITHRRTIRVGAVKRSPTALVAAIVLVAGALAWTGLELQAVLAQPTVPPRGLQTLARDALDDSRNGIATELSSADKRLLTTLQGTPNWAAADLDGDGPDDALVSIDTGQGTMMCLVMKNATKKPRLLAQLEGPWHEHSPPAVLNPTILTLGSDRFLVHQGGSGHDLGSWTKWEVLHIRKSEATLVLSLGEQTWGHQPRTDAPSALSVETVGGDQVLACQYRLDRFSSPLSYVGLRDPEFNWRPGSRVDAPRELLASWTQRYRWDAENERLVFDPDISDWPLPIAGFDEAGTATEVSRLVALVDLGFDTIAQIAAKGGGDSHEWIRRLLEWLPEGELHDRVAALIK